MLDMQGQIANAFADSRHATSAVPASSAAMPTERQLTVNCSCLKVGRSSMLGRQAALQSRDASMLAPCTQSIPVRLCGQLGQLACQPWLQSACCLQHNQVLRHRQTQKALDHTAGQGGAADACWHIDASLKSEGGLASKSYVAGLQQDTAGSRNNWRLTLTMDTLLQAMC